MARLDNHLRLAPHLAPAPWTGIAGNCCHLSPFKDDGWRAGAQSVDTYVAAGGGIKSLPLLSGIH